MNFFSISFVCILAFQNIAFACEEGSIVHTRINTELVCDKSLPGLQSAYRDPSGYVWGALPTLMNLNQAELECARIGARVPSDQDWEQFWKTFGYWSELNECKYDRKCYSPYVEGNSKKGPILPGLDKNEFWSTYYFGNKLSHTFGGNSGNFGGHVMDIDEEIGVICVSNLTH